MLQRRGRSGRPCSSTSDCSRSSPCSTASWRGRPSSAGGRATCRSRRNAAPTCCSRASRSLRSSLSGSRWAARSGRSNIQSARPSLYGLRVRAGVARSLPATFINHFDLFGLRQVWLHLRGREYTALNFGTPAPLPDRAASALRRLALRLLGDADHDRRASRLRARTTAYILLAIRLEERDLVTFHPEYEEYRQRVPMFIPGRRAAANAMSANPPRGASKNSIAPRS